MTAAPARIPTDWPAHVPRDWIEPGTLDRAREVQGLMAGRVVAADEAAPPGLVAGVDVSNAPRDPAAPVHAAVVLLDPLTLSVTGGAGASGPAAFPYVPGFLGFREIPQLLRAFRQLDRQPDLILVDGHGISHPRSLGIAAQLGVVLDLPTIGVAKSILVGRPEGELGEAPGSRVPLVWRGREIGAALRTRPRANPVYVSVGHRVSLDGAVRAVFGLTRGYRLPEPTRQAHLAANARRREAEPNQRMLGHPGDI